jgi:hypothetical protein
VRSVVAVKARELYNLAQRLDRYPFAGEPTTGRIVWKARAVAFLTTLRDTTRIELNMAILLAVTETGSALTGRCCGLVCTPPLVRN